MDPEQLFTSVEALRARIVEPDIDIDGNLSEVVGFRIPDPGKLTFGPSFMQGVIRKHLVQWPALLGALGRSRYICPGYGSFFVNRGNGSGGAEPLAEPAP